MSRPPTPPPYDPKQKYPSRAADDVSDIAAYVATIGKALIVASENAAAKTAGVDAHDDELRRTKEYLSTLGILRERFDLCQRIAAEYAVRDQNFTQLEAAKLLGVSAGTVYNWRLDPVSESRLQSAATAERDT